MCGGSAPAATFTAVAFSSAAVFLSGPDAECLVVSVGAVAFGAGAEVFAGLADAALEVAGYAPFDFERALAV